MTTTTHPANQPTELPPSLTHLQLALARLLAPLRRLALLLVGTLKPGMNNRQLIGPDKG